MIERIRLALDCGGGSIICFGIGLVGPGRYSVDAYSGFVRFTGSGYVLIATAVAVVMSIPLLARVVAARRAATSAAVPAAHVIDPADPVQTT